MASTDITSVSYLFKIGAAVHEFKHANGWINGHTWRVPHDHHNTCSLTTITTRVPHDHHYACSFMTITTRVPHDHNYNMFPHDHHHTCSPWPSLHVFPMTITTFSPWPSLHAFPHDHHYTCCPWPTLHVLPFPSCAVITGTIHIWAMSDGSNSEGAACSIMERRDNSNFRGNVINMLPHRLHSVFYKHSVMENTVWRKIHSTFLFIHVTPRIKWLLRHSVQLRRLELLIMRGYGALKLWDNHVLPQDTEGMGIHSAPVVWFLDGP